MAPFPFLAFLLLGYLIGSAPFSFWLTRAVAGVDLRRVGSGNLGFTNAARVLGWRIGTFVLLFDILKGLLPALLFPGWAGLEPEAGLRAEAASLAVAVSPVVGHIFSVFMRFRGGKGVATSVGVFLALAPAAALAGLVVGVGLIAATRYVSLGSMAGAIVAAAALTLLQPDRPLLVALMWALAVAILWLHRGNIRRLMAGEERRFGERSEPSAAANPAPESGKDA